MRRAVIIAAMVLMAGCHRHGGQDQTGAVQPQPGKLDANAPMKPSDIDAIAADVKRDDQARHHGAAANAGTEASGNVAK